MGRVVVLMWASCLLNVGRVVLGLVFFSASCLEARCLWIEFPVSFGNKLN